MGLPWRSRFAFGAEDFTLTLPVAPWDFLDDPVAGSAESGAGVIASFTVIRYSPLALPVRFFESEWPLIEALIIHGQTGASITWYPDADDPDLTYTIYLDSPEVGKEFEAPADGTYPRALSIVLVIRRTNNENWDTLPPYFDRSVPEPPPPPAEPVYELAQVVTGLLARHEYDNVDFPFNLAHWTAPANMALSLVGGALRGTVSLGGALRAARYDNVGVLSRCWAQQVIRGITVVTNNLQPGAVVHLGATLNDDDYIRFIYTMARPTTDLVALQEIINGASTVSVTSNIAARVVNVDHRIDVFADAGDALGYDHTSAIEKTITAPVRVSGRPGIGINSGGAGGVVEWRRVFFMSDRYVTVTGLPAGATVRIRDDATTILAEEAAVAGEAVLDLWQKIMPAATVEVVDVDDEIIATLSPAAKVWGGDEYELQEVTP